MLQAGWLRQLQHIMLYSLAFLIPFPFIYSSVAIISLLVASLLTLDVKQFGQRLRTRKAIWPWLLYFALFAVSYFYSSNKSQSLFDLQLKLGLLVLPLVIGACIVITREIAENVFAFFVGGVSIVAVISITNAIYTFNISGDAQVFFYEQLVRPIHDIHAVYMAWYTLFSLTVLLFFPWTRYSRGKFRYVRYILMAFLTAFFILLSSKTLIVLFFILVAPFYLRKTFRAPQGKLKVGLLAIIVTGLFTVLAVTNNPVKDRYKDVIIKNDLDKAWLTDYSGVDESRLSNLTIRVIAWRMSLENIKENNLWLTGAGNGDAQDLQNRKLASYHVQNWDRDYFDQTSELYNINVHNMFLQSFLMIGLPGLVLGLIIILSPFFYLNKVPFRPLFFIFHVTSFAFMLQESALQTQAGVIYYGFFAQIFWNIYYMPDNLKNTGVNIPDSKKI